jgi:splicing factor 3B subunit 3
MGSRHYHTGLASLFGVCRTWVTGACCCSVLLMLLLVLFSCALQVHAQGLRHIRTDRRINEWRAPGRRNIQRAATNTRQVAVSLSGRT